MFKNSKYVKLMCIVLVFSALALALSLGILAISALRNDTGMVDPLDGYEENLEKETIILPPPGGNKPNNNGPGEYDPGDATFPYQIRSEQAVNAIYLRGDSFGNYNGQEWGEAIPYTELINGKYPATYLGSLMIEEWSRAWGMDPIALEIKSNNTPLIIPSYTATTEYIEELMGEEYEEEYLIPEDDVNANPIGTQYYRMFYYNYTSVSKKTEKPTTYADYEKQYRNFVYDNYLYLDDESYAYMRRIIEEQRFDRYDQNVPQQIADYVSGLGSYLIEYDKNLDLEENVVISFIEEYKTGTCKHFASTATLLFRALGIPARYVTGYMVCADDENTWITLDEYNAHAWVEIYVDGFGWKTVEATPPQQNEPITIKPIDVKKKYDGTPLLPEAVIEGFEEFEELGYTYEVEVSGQRTEPGFGESIIEDIKIFDSNGVDVTNKFLIDKQPGTLAVLVGGVILRSEPISQVYDGIPRMSDLSKCSIDYEVGAKLLDGHTIRMEARELSTQIGVHSHSFNVIVEDSEGNDVTGLYIFSYALGAYNISPITITIKAGSAEREYIPGEALVCTDYVIIGDLIDGDYIPDDIVITMGEQLLPGVSANTINHKKIVILNAKGEDVSSNYIIVTEDGTLRVYDNE